MQPNSPLLPLPPNRVRRNYLGGAQLDQLQGLPNPTDSNQPEDWIASTTPALNPGLPPISDEGISRVPPLCTPTTPTPPPTLLTDLFAANPTHYLGPNRQNLGFLAKILDSATRLHVQAHPTAQFAQKYLNAPSGKLETYVILAVRPNTTPYIRLGFQRPPSPAEWKRIIMEQDIPAMDACFDPIPVSPGEVWLVPGGLPHAIGEGLLLLEVMEPSDLVVRCEFERAGMLVPPQARFMNRDPDLALRIFDYTKLSVDEVRARYRISPIIHTGSDSFTIEQLIGPTHTDCFSIHRLTITSPITLPQTHQLRIALVASGSGTISVNGQHHLLTPGKKFLLPAAAPPPTISPTTPLQLLLIAPPTHP